MQNIDYINKKTYCYLYSGFEFHIQPNHIVRVHKDKKIVAFRVSKVIYTVFSDRKMFSPDTIELLRQKIIKHFSNF